MGPTTTRDDAGGGSDVEFDEVDIMANMGSAKKKSIFDLMPAAEQTDNNNDTQQNSSIAGADSVTALDAFLNDILDLTSSGAGAAATNTSRELSMDEPLNADVDFAKLSIHEQRRRRKPKDAGRMLELVRKQLDDWSRHAGVMGVVCVNTDGCVITTNLDETLAREMAGRFHQLMPMVRRSVRQIDEHDELELLRFRTLNYEVLASGDGGYTMLIVSNPQQWKSSITAGGDGGRKNLTVNDKLLHKGVYKLLEHWTASKNKQKSQQ